MDADGLAGESLGFEGGGGGAGGTVKVAATTMTGGGVLSARGGAGGAGATFGGGGGGGGRVEVRLGSGADTVVSSATHRVSAGLFGAGATFGASGSAGTDFTTPRHWTGGGAGAAASTGGNWSGGNAPRSGERLVFGASETLKSCSWDLPAVLAGSVTVTAAFSTSVVLASSLTVTGTFDMAGGTVSAASNRALDLRGPASQTAGVVNLIGSTVTLRGGLHAFVDARMTVLAAGGLGASTVTLSGTVDARGRVELASGAHLSLSSGVLHLAVTDGPFAGAGTVSASTGHVTNASAGLAQVWTTVPGVLGGLRVSNTAGALTLSTATATQFIFAGGVSVDTGAVLVASAAYLRVGGDWSSYGATYLARSTVSFEAASGTQTVVIGGLFDHLRAAPAAGAALRFSSQVVVASTLTAVSGTLDLGASTVVVRGAWIEQAGALVLGGASRAVFDGSTAMVVDQRAGSSFGAFIASAPAGVRLATHTKVAWGFEWHRGNLDIAGRELSVGGDLIAQSPGTLSAFLSTVTLDGASTQTVNFTTLHGLVIDNRSPAGARLALALTVSSFTIRPGAAFDGFNRALVVNGSVFDTAGSTYLALAQLHSVTWNPADGTVLVGAGSVVNGRLILSIGRTARLLGDLTLLGAGNSFDARQGSTILNAPGGSTITFKGSSDFVPSSNANWTYAGGVADSWLVFEGTGLARGASLSTTTFGNLRVSLSSAADTFRAPDLNLLGNLVVEGGAFKPNGARTITLGGDLVQVDSGVVTFASSGTLRLAGPAAQTLRLIPSSHTLLYLTAQSTGGVTVAGGLTVRGDFVVAAGTFTAGVGTLSLQGSRVVVATGAYFDGGTSTVAFEGALNGKTWTGVANHGGGAFHAGTMLVSSITFQTHSTFSVLTDAVAGSTLAVSPGMRLRVGELRVDPGAGARIRLRSDAPGVPWQLELVTVSSVTGCIVSDSDASPGLTVRADDGRCANLGNNANWDFEPQLVTVFPGESLTPGVAPGKAGAPATLTAGATVAVSVHALSSRWDPIFISSPVALVADDPYAVLPASLTLVGGTTGFLYSPRVAEPSPRTSVLSAVASFSSGGSTLAVVPDALERLQVVLPGEAAAPGRPGGKTGTALARVVNAPFSATVRAVDRYANLVATVTHTVALAMNASSSTVTGPSALVAGARSFSGLASHATGYYTLTATDLTDPAVAAGVSALFGVAPPSVSSPTAAFHVPTGARVATLGGAVSGTASDSASVERVSLDLFDATAGLHYDWDAGAFTSAAASFATATLASPLAADTTWQALAPDAAFVSGRRYVFTATIDDPSGFSGRASSTFTFDRSTLEFGLADGQGSAAVLPVSTAGCASVTSTLTYTAAGAGITPGGAVAVRAPDGWSVAVGTTTAYPPPAGFWHAASTSAAMPFASLSVSPAALGPGWLLLELSTASPQSFLPGQTVVFTYAGVPALSARGRGPQSFPVLTRGGAGGTLLSISSYPVMDLAAGASHVAVFADPSPLTLAPLQTSATLQLTVEDRCGNSLATLSSGTLALSMVVPGPAGYLPDDTALILGSTGGVINSVFLSTGSALSPSFTVRTSTVGPAEVHLRATGVLFTSAVEAVRVIRLSTSPLAFTEVAAGTAPLPSGTTSAALSAADPQGAPARVAFRLAEPRARWELVLSTDASAFHPPVLRVSGAGDASVRQVVAWDGVDRVSDPPRYAAPGRYKARLRADGAAEDRTVEVLVPQGAALAGRLGARGAGAAVRAAGPGAGDGAFAVASATGYFLLRGVRPGAAYLVTVTTVSSAGGRLVALSTTVATGAAAVPVLDLGTLALPTTGLLRVAVVSPVPAPRELIGAFTARAGDGSVGASGPLRFSSGSASSDDAGPLFGRSASTWSAAAVPAGDWTVEVSVPELRLATAAAVSVAADGRVDLRLAPPKRGSVSGSVFLPSVPAAAVTVSVDARAAGAAAPAAAASTATASSTGTYALYGLDAGTYTVTASAPGYAAISSAVFVSTGADATLDLALGAGAAVNGGLSVTGDSTGLGATFSAAITARPADRLEEARTSVVLGASPTSSSGAFTLAGLSSGTWRLTAAVPGFGLVPSSGVTVAVPASGAVAATLNLVALDARLRLEVAVPALPGGACRSTQSYRSLGLLLEPAGAPPRFYPELVVMTPAFAAPRTLVSASSGAFALLHCASATVFTPALPPGAVRVWAGFLDTGARAYGGATAVAGSTATLALDLAVATTTVSGRVASSGEFTLSSRTAAGDAFTVTLSSAGGLNAWSPGPGPVLLGAVAPSGLRAFRAELRPVDPSGRASTAAALGAPIRDDGSFVFPGVSAGAWRLVVPGELDGLAEDGEEAAPFEAALAVGTAPVGTSALLGRGGSVSGRLTLPGGTRLTATLRVSLAGEDGAAPRVVEAAFADSAEAAFHFAAVPAGRWRLTATDPRRPAALAASPRLVVTGPDGVSGLDLRLVAAGALTGRLALSRRRADGTLERVLVTAETAELLPDGLRVRARALSPGSGSWDADPELDAEGRFLVAGLPPGAYELSVTAPGGVAPATVGGVVVDGGRVTDLGVVAVGLAASASGLLVDAATGLPAAGVAVTARPTSRSAPASRTVSDASGYWRVDGLDPAERFYDLTAAPRGDETALDAPAPYAARRLLGVDASTGPFVTFTLSPAASVLLGRVVTPDGGLLRAGAVLHLQRAGVPPQDDPLADLNFRTGTDGRFRVPSLSTGAYRLVVEAEGYGGLTRAVTLSTAAADLGDLLLPGGCSVAGALRRADGEPPSEAEVRAVAAVTPDLNEFVWGAVAREAGGGGVSYKVGGLKTGRTYRLLLVTGEDETVVPSGGEAVVFTSTGEARALDLTARPPRPSVTARATREGSRVTVEFGFSRALRARAPADLDPSLAATRVAGAGVLSGARLSDDRRVLTVDYDPAAGEGSFSLRARAAVDERDPDATDPAFPELVADATASFLVGVDAQHRAVVSNALGGALTAGSGPGRVVLPRGAFGVDASSAVALTFTRSTWNTVGAAPPAGLTAASPFYDVSLPAGVGATLTRPAQLVFPYSDGLDPATLNLYWYNPGSGQFVLSPDALGQAPVVDAAARTYQVNVGHFSTFVLLPASAGVIGGSANGEGSLEAYAFPNPFDLRAKTVTTIHGGGSPSIRGTMLRVAAPPGGGGAGSIRIYDAAGRLVRSLDLGQLAGGVNYYRDWDGRNSAGADVASGVYFAVVKVGSKAKTVKLAVLK
ncbi:MAG: carboxypeptidase regulatory-like domain-containing protein [Elusimicrobiota bacterium]|nr:carboxypeptidase regulatory-like domain-containing protein [Elusimicrobiota bacterium]